jgi:DNA-binding CsgD family transcriptional regulator
MPERTPPRISDILELAYRFDVPKNEWMRRLADDILTRRGMGPGTLAYELDLSGADESAKLGTVEATGAIESFAENTEPLHHAIGARIYRDLLQNGTHCSTIRTQLARLGRSLGDYPVLADMIHRSGAADIWAVHTVNPDARTLTFAIPLASPYNPSPRESRMWQKIGVHIAAGYRLRENLKAPAAGRVSVSSGDRAPTCEAEPASGAEAVLRPDGRPLHLEADTQSQREALSRAAVAIDRARARDYRNATTETLDIWQGLLEGTWSLVDWVDTDGSRYFLVIRNDPEAAGPKRLTRKEAQVATYAAQGHPYKVIAYELGVAISTVGTHLRHALDKLGLASRAELAWVQGHLTRQSASPVRHCTPTG